MADAAKDLEEDELRAQQTGIAEIWAEEHAEEEVEDAQELNRFFRVAEALRVAISDEREAQQLELGDDFTEAEREGIEKIAEAFTAQDDGKWLDAETRDRLLNQGLATLQPVLALGLVPELNARDIYEDLAGRVGELRERLEKLADAQEEVQRTEDELAAESDEDDDDDADEDEDADADAEAKAEDKKAAATLEGDLDYAARRAKKHQQSLEHLGLVDPEPLPTEPVKPKRGGGKS
jgi:hypothetical protein